MDDEFEDRLDDEFEDEFEGTVARDVPAFAGLHVLAAEFIDHRSNRAGGVGRDPARQHALVRRSVGCGMRTTDQGCERERDCCRERPLSVHDVLLRMGSLEGPASTTGRDEHYSQSTANLGSSYRGVRQPCAIAAVSSSVESAPELPRSVRYCSTTAPLAGL